MCTKNQSHEVWFHLLLFYSPLPALMIWKIRILKKWKKHLEISSFYTCVPKITITWMLPKIWSATDIIFCHFGSFFALLHHYWTQKLKVGKNLRSTSRYYTFTHVHHKWRSYDVWFLRYEARQNFFVILGYFWSFSSLTIWKIKILKKWKKHLEISSFYTSAPKIMIICYTVPEIWHN